MTQRSMTMTPDRKRILEYLARFNSTTIAPTAREISRGCGERSREADWAHGKLRDLAWHGLVSALGIAFDNSRTWQITDAGRALLAQGMEAGTGETEGLDAKRDSPVANGDAP